jgi:rubrerythrin
MQQSTNEPRDAALDRVTESDASRRRFLKMVGGTGGFAALSVLVAACGGDDEENQAATTGADTETQTQAEQGGGGDLEIVNYALTLEFLEADFYDQVEQSGIFKGAELDLIKTIGQHEQEHVDALTETAKQLGTPAEKPRTAFEPVIEGGREAIIAAAADVENLGAAAYLGQAGKIQSAEILAAALAIHTVEARHAAALNEIAGRGFKGDGALQGSIPDGAFAKPMSMEEVLDVAKQFIAS